VNVAFGKLPGFTAVKQDGLYVGVKDPYFGVCCRSPDYVGVFLSVLVSTF
jgi:hypothetical protein